MSRAEKNEDVVMYACDLTEEYVDCLGRNAREAAPARHISELWISPGSFCNCA